MLKTIEILHKTAQLSTTILSKKSLMKVTIVNTRMKMATAVPEHTFEDG